MKKPYLIIGTWYDKKKVGIKTEWNGKELPRGFTVCEFDEEKGSLEIVDAVEYKGLLGVGKCFVDESNSCFYCTDERADFPGIPGGGGGGTVRAYKLDRESGKLSFINEQPSFGAKPSFVCSDEQGKYLLLTNHGERAHKITSTTKDEKGEYHISITYDESNVVLFPLGEDGSIGAPKDILRLSGEGPRHFQRSPHAHSVMKAPGRNLYSVCDKGGDQIYMLKIDYENAAIVQCPGSPVHRHAGSAVRYSIFHPTLPYLYVNKEAEARMSVFRYDDEGRLEELQVIENTIPEGYQAPPEDSMFQSDVEIDADGRHCYLFMREVNIVNCYDIDQETGILTYRSTTPTAHGVRLASFSPGGKYMAVSYPFINLVEILPIEPDGSVGKSVFSLPICTPGSVNFCRG